jgi:hypothetical protein
MDKSLCDAFPTHNGLKQIDASSLWRLFRPKEEEVMGECRKLHDELHDFYSSSYNIMVRKSRRMSWAGHVIHMLEIRNSHKILMVNLK